MKNLFLKILVISFACSFVIGCSTVTYTSPDGSRISYTRLGDQELSGLVVDKDGNKLNVKLDGQKSEATALVEAVKIIGDMSKAVK